MKNFKSFLLAVLAGTILLTSCDSMNNTQKGAVIGTAGGAAIGTAIGSIFGKAGWGTAAGAVVGGVAGTVIGKKMDKQAADIKNQIPDAKVERVDEGIVVEFNSSVVVFSLNKADLTANSKATLDKLIAVLNQYPDTNLEIQGHTDNSGTDAINDPLSQKRADAVVAYLVQKGILASRLTAKGFGSKIPKYSNDTDANRALNRRVEFVITANDKMKQDAQNEAQKQ